MNYWNKHDRVIAHQGTLDYCEFVIDPENEYTELPDELWETVQSYFDLLGMTTDEMREWLLNKLREERELYENL